MNINNCRNCGEKPHDFNERKHCFSIKCKNCKTSLFYSFNFDECVNYVSLDLYNKKTTEDRALIAIERVITAWNTLNPKEKRD